MAPLLYSVLPLFFHVGPITLTAVLALGRPRLASPRVLVLVLLATVVMAAGLDLMPLGGLLLAATFGQLDKRIDETSDTLDRIGSQRGRVTRPVS